MNFLKKMQRNYLNLYLGSSKKYASNKFNNLSNTGLAVIILFGITILIYFVNSLFVPTYEVTNTNVGDLINNWNVRITSMSCLIIMLMYRQFLIFIWERYNKKLQGNIRQNKFRG